MRSKEIVIPILNDTYKVIVLISDKASYIQEKLKSWGYNDTDRINGHLDGRQGVTFRHEGCHPVIAVPDVRTPQQVGTLAHEAVHAVHYIFEMISETNLDEVFAHSVGAIVRSTLNSLSPQREKGKE